MENVEFDQEIAMNPIVPTEMNYNIWEAAQRGNLQRIRHLIEIEKVNVNELDTYNSTALHWAALNSQIPTMEYLITQGADLEVLGGEIKATPLAWACRQNSLSAVACLLKNGADPDCVDVDGYSCLHLAANQGDYHMCLLLITYCANVNLVDFQGRTPLIWSCFADTSITIPSLLLENGADAHHADFMGYTALHWTVFRKNMDHSMALLAKNADFLTKNCEGSSPLDIAEQSGITLSFKNALISSKRISSESEFDQLVGRPTSEQIVKVPTFDENGNPNGERDIVLTQQKQSSIMIKYHEIQRYFQNMPPKLREERFMVKFPIGFISVMTLIIGLSPIQISLPIVGVLTLMAALFYAKCLSPNDEISSGPILFIVVLSTMVMDTILFLTNLVLRTPIGLDIFFLISLALASYYLHKTYTDDPGYIPKLNVQEEACRKIITKLALENNLNYSSYCHTCNNEKIKRSKHCRHCDKCVNEFDHHCPFVHNCVGKNNHPTFVKLLIFAVINRVAWLALGGVYFSVLSAGQPLSTAFSIVITTLPWLLISMVWSFINVIWIFFLALWQIGNIGMGITTNEYVKIRRGAMARKSSDRFFLFTFFRNLYHFFQKTEPRYESLA